MFNRIKRYFKNEQTPTVTVIITQEQIEELADRIPSSIIVNKVKEHIKTTGTSGLAGDINNILR